MQTIKKVKCNAKTKNDNYNKKQNYNIWILNLISEQ